MKKQFKVGSLFAGVGGICLGFMNATNPDAEFVMSWANEIDEFACETFRHNFKHTLLEGDINLILHPEKSDNVDYYTQLKERILAEPIDILDGGFPCQAFSIAGEQKGFNDERGNLFMSFIDLINQLDAKFGKKPRILFLENVKNLKSHDKGRTYQVIKSKLEESGYTIKECVLNTMLYSNLPQNRERIYIVGFRTKKVFEKFTFPEPIPLKKTIHDVIDFINPVDEKYLYTKGKYKGDIYEKLVAAMDDSDAVYQWRRKYVRKNMSGVVPTLTANQGEGGHNVCLVKTKQGIRKMTPKECFNTQGFPESFVLPDIADGRLYKQAGNSVCVSVIQRIAEQMLVAMK